MTTQTITPAGLAGKGVGDLWALRQQVVKSINDLSEHVGNAAPTSAEQAIEQEHVGYLRMIDARFDEIARGQSNSKYDHLFGRSLSQRDEAADQWFRSAIVEKNPAAFILEPDEQRDFSVSQPGFEYRDLLSTTATQALPKSVYSNFMLHMVEATPVLRAGALLVTTATGEELVIPKSTAFQSSALTSEGGLITESDPTLAVTSLKAYKYASFWEVSRELVEDSPANLLDALARGAAASLAAAYGDHLANGNGTGQPLGYLSASVGKQGVAGTTVSLGAQTTAGMGTDLILDLYSSILEPYALSPAVGMLGRNASLAIIKKLRDSTSRPVLDCSPIVPGSSANVMGVPYYVDPFTPAMAVSAKSMAFGDWSRFAVRIVRGVRIERSDEFHFQNDLASFKATVRLDAALVDSGAIKLFQNSAT
jgi:HK97 family phage major capsid protein